MKSLWLKAPFLLTAFLVSLFSLVGGCSPKMLAPLDVPQEQQAYIRGTVGGAVFAGAQIVSIDEETLSSGNAAYILPGEHTVKLLYNNPGGGPAVGPVELRFKAEAGHEYTAKWHYSWSQSYYYFSIEDAQSGKVVVSGGEIRP